MMKIDVNSDMGEGFGVYQLCDDEALMQVVSSANIACGFHAGDPAINGTPGEASGCWNWRASGAAGQVRIWT